MNAVVYYSNTGQSRSVASYLASQLEYPLQRIEDAHEEHYRDLVLVFPVHCQDLPACVKSFLKRVSAENLTAVATYGKMCCGNVLHEIQTRYHQNVVAGAYVPAKHAYLEADTPFCRFDELAPILEKVKHPSPVRLPRRYRNPLSGLIPKWRSQAGLRIDRSADCNGCNLCSACCPTGAIQKGRIRHSCIRCLRCVESCPRQALRTRLGIALRIYLKKKPTDALILYV